jgi:transcription antitermination factor NusA-like protein
MLVKKYWHLDVRADIYSGAGMVIVPEGHEIGPIIGPNGQHRAKLMQITGLARIVVIRSVSSKRQDLRLSAAVRQITGLEGVKVRPPKKDTQEWRLIVRSKEANVLIGSHGINLYFIKSAAGLSITHLIRDSK